MSRADDDRPWTDEERLAGQRVPSPTERMEAIGRSGLTISIVCGPSGVNGFRWSVQVLSSNWQEFPRPFAADSLAHAVEIAEREIAARQWR